MAIAQPVGSDLTFKTATDLSAKQFFLVKMSASETVALAAATTDVVIGVMQNKPKASGHPASVRVVGVAKVIYGGTVTAGNRLGPDSAGKAVAVTADGGNFIGVATRDGSSGDIGEVLLGAGMQRGA